jgi:hypothetical protein
VRQDCSFGKKRESPPALLVVVPLDRERRLDRAAQTAGFIGKEQYRAAHVLAVQDERLQDAVSDTAAGYSMPGRTLIRSSGTLVELVAADLFTSGQRVP